MRRGFTLLEVMVSVAILGLGVTAILSAQFSAVKGASHARHMSMAVGLARCKMSELEQYVGIEGYQELDIEDAGPCCEGDSTPNVSCSWSIARPVFPEPNFGQLDLGSGSDFGTSALGSLVGGAESGQLGGQLGGLSAGAGGLSDLTSTLTGGTGDLGALAAGGVGGIASMLMVEVYPQLRPILEASARRITVVLTWTEGARSYQLEVVQWITQPQPGMTMDLDDMLPGGGMPGQTSGQPGGGRQPGGMPGGPMGGPTGGRR